MDQLLFLNSEDAQAILGAARIRQFLGSLELTVSLFPSHILFGCGHKIEASMGEIESMHDGMDLSLCPACKQD